MPVYMIRAGENGPVKIGFAESVVLRLTKMQADNHERLIVLRVLEGGEAEEATLHIRFADNHLHGEWFGFSKTMLGDVGLPEIDRWKPEPQRPKPRFIQEVPEYISQARSPWIAGTNLRELRRERDLTQAQVSSATGIGRSTLAAIEMGHDLPGRDSISRLAAFFGTTVDELMQPRGADA